MCLSRCTWCSWPPGYIQGRRPGRGCWRGGSSLLTEPCTGQSAPAAGTAPSRIQHHTYELHIFFITVSPAHLTPVLHLALGAAVGDHLALAAPLLSSLLGLRPGVMDTVHALLGCHGVQYSSENRIAFIAGRGCRPTSFGKGLVTPRDHGFFPSRNCVIAEILKFSFCQYL
jgi:hypothetical protein